MFMNSFCLLRVPFLVQLDIGLKILCSLLAQQSALLPYQTDALSWAPRAQREHAHRRAVKRLLASVTHGLVICAWARVLCYRSDVLRARHGMKEKDHDTRYERVWKRGMAGERACENAV